MIQAYSNEEQQKGTVTNEIGLGGDHTEDYFIGVADSSVLVPWETEMSSLLRKCSLANAIATDENTNDFYR